MPRQTKGPRLYLRKGRKDSRTGATLPDRWFIRDGSKEVSTGCGLERLDEAERQLAAYIAEKWSPGAHASDPGRVLIDDVLTFYGMEKSKTLRTDHATNLGFVAHLLSYWSERPLSDVRSSSCKEYVAFRTKQKTRNGSRNVSDQTARRELEVLSAAIGVWDKEHHLSYRPKVTLPQKTEGHREALSRSDAARLLMAARGWRWKDGKWERVYPGDEEITGKLSSVNKNRAHLRRFILISLYTGSRSGVTMRLMWKPSPVDPWVDLEAGAIYRSGKRETVARNKRRPVVKLPHRLCTHLERWKRLDEKKGIACVIHHGKDRVSSVRRSFASCIRDAGLTDATPHWLRHTAATWLMEAGVDIWEASGYLGMTPEMLTRTYGHHRPDHQKSARRAFK